MPPVWQDCDSCPTDCGACLLPGPYRFCEKRSEKVMALTFDDGPTYTTEAVLDLLKEFGAKVTFFNIGSHVKAPLAQRLMREGHALGGHTHTHREMTFMNMTTAWDDTITAELSIRNATGRSTKYMRPPFGRFTWDTLDAFAAIGYKMILWSAGTWPETRDAVLGSAEWSMKLGDRIFMFHGEKDADGARHADQSTLRAILEAAKRLGVKLVTVDTCLGDHQDGAYKSRDGACKDDGCRCSAAAPGLPSTARSVCFKGDLTTVIDGFQLVYPDVPDYCKLDVGGTEGGGATHDLKPVRHWWQRQRDEQRDTSQSQLRRELDGLKAQGHTRHQEATDANRAILKLTNQVNAQAKQLQEQRQELARAKANAGAVKERHARDISAAVKAKSNRDEEAVSHDKSLLRLKKELAAAKTQSSLDLVDCLQAQHACTSAAEQTAALFEAGGTEGVAEAAARCAKYKQRLIATQGDIKSIGAFAVCVAVAVAALLLCNGSPLVGRSCSLLNDAEFPRVKAKASC